MEVQRVLWRAALPMKFGREIRRRRKALGWTLEVLAEKSGLSPHYLSTVERDARDPSLSTIEALAKAFGVPAGELLGPIRKLSPTSLEAARLFDAAPEPVQEGVLKILHAVVGGVEAKTAEHDPMVFVEPRLPARVRKLIRAERAAREDESEAKRRRST